MTHRPRRRLGLVLLAGLAACGRSREAPSLPPLRLEPVVPKLEEIARLEPDPPGDERRRVLADEARAAFAPNADPDLARRARRRLLREPGARAVLEELLVGEPREVRMGAAALLGDLGDPLAAPPILWRLRWETDPAVRLAMADALVRLGTDWPLSVFVEAIRGGALAQEAYEAALPVFERAGVRLPSSPTWRDVEEALLRVRRAFLRQGRPLGGDPIPLTDPLRGRLARLLLGLTEFQLRPVDEARWVLARMGVTPLPLLRLALHAEETYLRTHTLEIVRDLGPPAAALVEDVIALLSDPASRLYAIEALGAMEAFEAAGHLARLLDDRDEDVRAAAAEALGPADGYVAIERLRDILHDEREAMDLRVRAAFSLAWMEKGGEGFRFLEERLERGDYHEPTVREWLDRLKERGIPREHEPPPGG